MRSTTIFGAIFTLVIGSAAAATAPSPIVDTGQIVCYGASGGAIPCPGVGESLSGQDAQFEGSQPAYLDNGDGTVTDLVTGLMWQQSPGDKKTWAEAFAGVESVRTGGYTDWRVPTIKELYSLIDFSGSTGMSAATSVPYVNTDYFDFAYGDQLAGERFIDAQYMSATEYVSTTMGGNPTVFGVNFADGRIKGYPKVDPRGWEKPFFVLHVRGAGGYGQNDFRDNGDGTISDLATGLVWSGEDSGEGMTWPQALAWVEEMNAEHYLGHDDWRLPNAKELQSLVDYTRSPDTTGTAAIDPLFGVSVLPDGEYPYFWTSTTHLDGRPELHGIQAVYVAFGRALGFMEVPPGSGQLVLLDVHGAGAQRSDPKVGDPEDFPYGRGPQGDVIRIFNYVRLVRDAENGPFLNLATS